MAQLLFAWLCVLLLGALLLGALIVLVGQKCNTTESKKHESKEYIKRSLGLCCTQPEAQELNVLSHGAGGGAGGRLSI